MKDEIHRLMRSVYNVNNAHKHNEPFEYGGGLLAVLPTTGNPFNAFFKTYGDDWIIEDITAFRTPVNSAVTKIMSIASLGKFGDWQKYYDRLFHLKAIIRMRNHVNGSVIFVLTEKTPFLTFKEVSPMMLAELQSKQEHLTIRAGSFNRYVRDWLTELQAIYDRAGLQLFGYDGKKNNCQFYISSVVQAVGLPSSTMDLFNRFILQDLAKHFTGLTSWLSAV